MVPNPSPVKNHPTTLFKTKEQGFNFMHSKCIDFLEEQAFLQPKCYAALTACHANCKCLNVFHRQDDGMPPLTNAAANYMVYFAELMAIQQHATIVDWLKYTKYCTPNEQMAHCVFIMLTRANSLDDDDIDDVEDIDVIDASILAPPRICSGAMLTILGIGKRMWRRCKALSETNKKAAPHALVGKTSNRATHFNKEVADELHLFLWEISQLATPTATRFVRERTGVLGVQNNGINKIYLEPWYSKRSLFDGFCWERGSRYILLMPLF